MSKTSGTPVRGPTLRHHRNGSLPWLVLFFAWAAPLLSAAQADSPGLLALRTALQGHTLTLKIAGVHAATRVFLHPIDNRIVGGSVQNRAIDILRGSGDFPLPAGAAVRVVKVEEATDAHNDLLRIGVTAPGGGYASLAFLSGRGTLTASSTSQLAALIAPVFDGPALAGLNGTPAPLPTGNTADNAPVTSGAAPPSLPPAPAHSANTVVDLPPGALQETAASKPSRATKAATKTPVANEGVPRPGEWVYVQHSYTHDIARNAATAASFSAVTGAAPKQAKFYLGCNGAAPGGPHVELRAVYPATPGYGPGETGHYGSLLLPGSKRQMIYSLVNAGQMTFLTLPLTPADLAVLSFEDETEQNGLAVLFGVGLATATVTADVPPDNAALEDVIRACHVNLPPRPPKPLAALPPDQVTHLELAKIALGMTEEKVRAALGSQYQFASQTDSRFSNLTFLGAWGTDSTYSATLVDGKVAGFNYFHVFAPGAQPLQANIVDGITAKAWSPIFNRPPYNTFWVTDAQGIPKLKPRPDRSIHPCANIKMASFTPTRGVLPGAQPARALDRVLPKDNGPDCGVTISLSTQPSPSGNGTVVSLNLSAANDIVFHQFISVVNAANQQQRKAEHDKLNSVPTPF